MAERRVAGWSDQGAPTTGFYTVGDFVFDTDGSLWKCTVAGTPGTWVEQTVGATDVEVTAAVAAHAAVANLHIVQQAAVANAAGGAVVDTEARAALNALLARLRLAGLLAP